MAPFAGIVKMVRSMSRRATRLRKQTPKQDNPITDDEAQSHDMVGAGTGLVQPSPRSLVEHSPEAARTPSCPAISLEKPHAELESILIEEVPKYQTRTESRISQSSTASAVKYDFQDPTGPPGQLYRGEFKDSKKHGSGTMSFAEDDREGRFMYKGDFVDGKMHGSGVLDWHDGKNYKGQFESDRLHGEGVMNWPDGRKYIGHYLKGRKHGLGTVQYPSGSSYCGNFMRGKMHGEVVYTNEYGLDKLVRFRLGKPMHSYTSVIGEGAGASDATTDISSIYGGSVATSGTDNGAGLSSMLDDMFDGVQLGEDENEEL